VYALLLLIALYGVGSMTPEWVSLSFKDQILSLFYNTLYPDTYNQEKDIKI